MRQLLMIGVVAGLLSGCAGLDPRASYGPDHHISYTPEQVAWRDGPVSLPAGSEIAVLEGDPGEKGMLVMRLRFPDDYRVPPHWHPNFERVTVLDGTFQLGMGEVFDEDATETLEAGSFTVMPPEMRHFAVAEGETTIQITTIGPWEITYVDPADDPRR